VARGPIDRYVDCHVAVITLAHGEHGNLLNLSALRELSEAFERSLKDPDVRAILLRSNGPAFCLGMDLEKVAAGEPGFEKDAGEAVGLYSAVLSSMFESPLPIVCLVEGDVKAGGVGLTCAADIVIASENAVWELTEVLFGMIPANVMPYLLAVRVPLQKVRGLVLGCERLSASDALRLNLADAVVPQAAIEKKLKDVFKKLLRSSPAALAEMKAFSAALLGKAPEAGAEMARAKLREILRNPATGEAVKAFMDGEVPSWFTRFKPERPLSLAASALGGAAPGGAEPRGKETL
jgi:enoyl-CoA hydratase/carnithine racemase